MTITESDIDWVAELRAEDAEAEELFEHLAAEARSEGWF